VSRLILLVAACALLWTLETAWPLRRRGERLRHAIPNVGLTALVVAMNLGLSVVTVTVAGREGGGWAMGIAGIVVLDLATYAAHVALHKSAVGWRFHRLHHSDREVDVTTAFRQHPLETIFRVASLLPAIALLRIPLGVVVLHQTLSAINAQLEHANVRVPEGLDRALRVVFVTPNMHKVHHSSWRPQTDSNYANLFSLWDRLFGTFTRAADLGSLRYGL
jgi:sterol desaturase/sphingolipid hydroxylase (fatty acid hydroxylase superfamily)